MRSHAPGRPARPPSPAPARRFIPSLPTLEPWLLAPTLEPLRPPVYPLDQLAQPHAQLFYLARAGVHRTIRQWLEGERGTVLMPSYHHGVEVEAVRAVGADVAFYRVDAEMRIDVADLQRRMAGCDVKAVYLTHFVGFAQPVREVAALCAARGLPLFEDCALALLSRDPEGRPLGSTGHASVFCLYKTLPVPHGGLLLAPGVPVELDITAPPITSTLHHAAGLVLAHLELTSPTVGKAVREAARRGAHATVDAVVETVQTGTMHLDPRDLGLGASRLVERLLPRFDLEMVIVRRRRNFRRLADALREHLHVYGDPLQPGACPLFVPVRVQDKPSVLQKLHARGIDAIDFWGTGDAACSDEEFPEVAALRRECLELPCHQSLDDEAVDFVAQAVKDVLGHA
jgi:perosamine synthetase